MGCRSFRKSSSNQALLEAERLLKLLVMTATANISIKYIFVNSWFELVCS